MPFSHSPCGGDCQLVGGLGNLTSAINVEFGAIPARVLFVVDIVVGLKSLTETIRVLDVNHRTKNHLPPWTRDLQSCSTEDEQGGRYCMNISNDPSCIDDASVGSTARPVCRDQSGDVWQLALCSS